MKLLSHEEIEACRRIGRDEVVGYTTIGLTELDALCDTAQRAVAWHDKADDLSSRLDEAKRCKGGHCSGKAEYCDRHAVELGESEELAAARKIAAFWHDYADGQQGTPPWDEDAEIIKGWAP